MNTSESHIVMLLLLWHKVQVQIAVVLCSKRGSGVIQMWEVIAHGHAHPTVARGLRLARKA